jgi:hypothetical protein
MPGHYRQEITMSDDTKVPAYKPDVRWAIGFREAEYHGGSRYVHITARAMILGRSTVDNQLGLFDPDSYELPYRAANRALHGLQVTAQSDQDHMRYAGGEFYGWEVGYDRHLVDLAGAEDIVKALRKVNRKMDALTRELGRPATIAQYITYVARAFASGDSSRVFVRYVGEDNDYEGTGYRSMDADDLAGHIWNQCAEWRKRYGVEVLAES